MKEKLVKVYGMNIKCIKSEPEKNGNVKAKTNRNIINSVERIQWQQIKTKPKSERNIK